MKRSYYALPFCLVGLAVVALALALSDQDLAISQALHSPTELLGYLVNHFGEIPAFVLYPLALGLLCWPAKRRLYPVLSACAAAVLAQAVLHTYLFTGALKWAIGRPRYFQVLEGALYASPFNWNPGSGFVSFPSGHEATAVVWLPIAILLWRAGKRLPGLAVLVATLLFGAIVGFGRIEFGMHYFSDVTASMGFALMFAPLTAYLGARLIARLDRRA